METTLFVAAVIGVAIFFLIMFIILLGFCFLVFFVAKGFSLIQLPFKIPFKILDKIQEFVG